MYRSTPIVANNYYHIYTRGIRKQPLFKNKNDFVRMIFLILYSQSPIALPDTKRQVDYFVRRGAFKIGDRMLNEIIANRFVELINFCCMPNHIHMTLFNKTGNGISRYAQRIFNAYGKYSNLKYNQSGHVFESTFRARIIDDENYLTYLSAYIHRNPREMRQWKNREHEYQWSSFQDYVKENRWGKLLKPTAILERFPNKDGYLDFVNESAAKMFTGDEN